MVSTAGCRFPCFYRRLTELSRFPVTFHNVRFADSVHCGHSGLSGAADKQKFNTNLPLLPFFFSFFFKYFSFKRKKEGRRRRKIKKERERECWRNIMLPKLKCTSATEIPFPIPFERGWSVSTDVAIGLMMWFSCSWWFFQQSSCFTISIYREQSVVAILKRGVAALIQWRSQRNWIFSEIRSLQSVMESAGMNAM